VAFVGKLDHTRPWADLKHVDDAVRYIPPPVSEQGGDARVGGSTGGQRRKTRRNRGGVEKGQEENKEFNTGEKL
jgi:hypothetical protein